MFDRKDMWLTALLGFATAVLLAFMVDAFGQTAPVPIRPIVRPAYQAAPELPQDWRPIVRPAPGPAPEESLLGGPPARLRYVPLPGSHSCSLAPGGKQVCGPGVWIADDRETRR